VDGSFATPVKLRHVNPVYPPSAQAAGEQGVVIIDARIDVDGRIRFARIFQSVPGLDQAALDAVTQWEFTPTVIGGGPIPVLLTVTVHFTLP
jgi:protein TonB